MTQSIDAVCDGNSAIGMDCKGEVCTNIGKIQCILNPQDFIPWHEIHINIQEVNINCFIIDNLIS